jgi:hypothetical protein
MSQNDKRFAGEIIPTEVELKEKDKKVDSEQTNKESTATTAISEDERTLAKLGVVSFYLSNASREVNSKEDSQLLCPSPSALQL